ncbi:thioredoxin family protein [Natrarchaeobius chitinivorans]|uniref:Thioredoxin n=1 Tax=Natrarchaeobius chitinivorans TaxID=1679083 RepID=A0A3N6P2M1_NATCH|nr:thioredoxin family protein [Natrarchaeobius chitinivorans]RQG89435.1 thioredoxin [Natrarchaeobius chitinivorans]
MEPKPVRLEDGDELEAFVDEHGTCLVEFYTSGCSKCQAMEPVLGNVARATGVPIGLVNPGQDLELVDRFDVQSVPTLVLFDDEKPIARRSEGFLGGDDVVGFLGEHVPNAVEPA